jgi:hypothetical protein
MIDASVDSARPSPADSNGSGSMSRRIDVTTMTVAATNTMPPSTAADTYSALPCPNWWIASGGRAARRKAHRPTAAATRLTPDSIASDSRLTDPVISAAMSFRTIVATAAASETSMNRIRVRCSCRSFTATSTTTSHRATPIGS